MLGAGVGCESTEGCEDWERIEGCEDWVRIEGCDDGGFEGANHTGWGVPVAMLTPAEPADAAAREAIELADIGEVLRLPSG